MLSSRLFTPYWMVTVASDGSSSVFCFVRAISFESRCSTCPTIFKRCRSRYYELLQAVRDNGEWEEWLDFFLEGVVEVSNQATETAHAILQLREGHRNAITASLGRSAGNGHKLLEYLYRHPIISVKEAQDVIGTTFPAANEAIGRMVDLDILREITGQARNRKFMYQSYINLFTSN